MSSTYKYFVRECLWYSFLSDIVDDPLSLKRPGIGANLLFLFFEGIIFFALTLIIQVHLE